MGFKVAPNPDPQNKIKVPLQQGLNFSMSLCVAGMTRKWILSTEPQRTVLCSLDIRMTSAGEKTKLLQVWFSCLRWIIIKWCKGTFNSCIYNSKQNKNIYIYVIILNPLLAVVLSCARCEKPTSAQEKHMTFTWNWIPVWYNPQAVVCRILGETLNVMWCIF